MGSILDDTGTSGVLVGSIAANAITATAIQADAIAAAKIATGALTADAFAADALVAATFATGAFTADAFAADALVAATFATDSIAADALAADAVTEIAVGINAEDESVYYYQVQKSEPTAGRRTLYFRVLGTLPAKASISVDGATFGNSTNAPATVNGNFRKLVLEATEVAALGRKMINVTTTGTVDVATIIVDVVQWDPFTEGARPVSGNRAGIR